ncbi:MAG: hypothetical protein AAF927_25970, partial [Bacteroidota bacterium]
TRELFEILPFGFLGIGLEAKDMNLEIELGPVNQRILFFRLQLSQRNLMLNRGEVFFGHGDLL